MKYDYTRQELIDLALQAVTPQECWHNRDSAIAVRQAAECGALLRAGCDFLVSLSTTNVTIWVEISFHGFDYFEVGHVERDTFYLPTPSRIEAVGVGKDWY